MNNFAELITPEEYLKRYPDQVKNHDLKELKRMAKSDGTCMNCDEPVWKLAGCGLCFSCTTGEASAEDDYELVPSGKADE